MENKPSYQLYRRLLAFCCFFLGFYNVATGQYNFTVNSFQTPQIDTLLISERSGGNQIDSLDRAYYDFSPSLFGAGRSVIPTFRNRWENLPHRYFFSDDRTIYRANFHFTALPYTGFFYSFGGGGEQILDLRYSQNVGQNLNLSFRYHRTTSDAGLTSFLMRQMESKTNDLSLNLHFRKGRLHSFLSSYYGFDNNRESFGTTESVETLNAFPLAQLPVNNTIAATRIRRAQVQLRNEIRLSSDSLPGFKFVNQVGFHNFQRRYKDSLTASNFEFWIYDSMNTTDLWEEPHATLENGLQWKTNTWKLYAGFNLDFYRYMNRGIRNERLDGIVKGALNFRKQDISLAAEGQFFIFGTPEEYNLKANAAYQVANKVKLEAALKADRIFPEFFQIHYLGNRFAYNYENQVFQATQNLNVGSKLQIGEKQKIALGLDFTSMQNLYVFDSLGWSDTTNQRFISPNLGFTLQAGIFKWNGSASVNIGEKESLLLPDFLASSRLYIQTALFKAKRLKIATGAELQYFNGISNILYFPEIGLYSSTSALPAIPPANMFLNAFVNIEIDRFRFFVNANRINHLFESSVSALIHDYPVRPFFIRMGITWDFVN